MGTPGIISMLIGLPERSVKRIITILVGDLNSGNYCKPVFTQDPKSVYIYICIHRCFKISPLVCRYSRFTDNKMAHVITFTSLPRWVRQGDAVPRSGEWCAPDTVATAVHSYLRQAGELQKHPESFRADGYNGLLVTLSKNNTEVCISFLFSTTPVNFDLFSVYGAGVRFSFKVFQVTLKVNRFVRRMEDLSFLV